MKILISIAAALVSQVIYAEEFYLLCKIDRAEKFNEYSQPISSTELSEEKPTKYFINIKKNTIEANFIFGEIRNLKIDKFSIGFQIYGEDHCAQFRNQIFESSEPVKTIKSEYRNIDRLTGDYVIYEYSCEDEEAMERMKTDRVLRGRCVKYDKPLF